MASTDPRVTVVIPTFNRGHWLRHSIAAVLAQTYHDFVLLVSDNASTDATPEVVGEFDDPRIRYVRHPTNLGLIGNHNASLAEVETEYVLVIPDDDLLYPSNLEVTVAALDRHPSAGLVHTAFDIIDENGAIRRAGVNWTYTHEADALESGAEFLTASMRWSCRICFSTALVRTAALPHGFMSERDFPAVDLGMWLRMARDWDFLYLHRTLGAYRIHGSSHSAAFGPTLHDGYVQDTEIINQLHMLKHRYIGEHATELQDAAGLRRLADESRRHELLVLARNRALPDLPLRVVIAGLRTALAQDRRLLADWTFWRILLSAASGRRVRTAVRRAARGRTRDDLKAGAPRDRHMAPCGTVDSVRGGT
jgi:hypothetical protein